MKLIHVQSVPKKTESSFWNHAIISSCVKTVEKTSTKKKDYSEKILVRRTKKNFEK